MMIFNEEKWWQNWENLKGKRLADHEERAI
jgi:hypothetical protein